MDLFDYSGIAAPTGQELALEGMTRAVEHADREIENWSDRAMQYLRIFAQMERRFMSEQVRAWAEEKGLESPPDPRAWGAVMRRAVIERLVRADGYEPSKNPKAHHRPTQVWASLTHKGVRS